MNKGILLSAGAAVLLGLVGVASAASKDDGEGSPLPPPTTPSIRDKAIALTKHEHYGHWREAHGYCLYPSMQVDPNDPNSYNVAQKLHTDACNTADALWRQMTTELGIPESQWDAVKDALNDLESE